MASPSSFLAAMSFLVKRCEPELVVPAKPTPREVKKLSKIDSQPGLRFQVPIIWFYKNSSNNNSDARDPVRVVREALGETLVYYYPLAGRLIEDDNKNLMVDCNGRGVLFIEASADVTLQQLGPTIQPPFPYLDEVLYNVPGSDGILGCPLFQIQMTRLVCGGAQHPSVPPVWQRELLDARNPPRITRIHHENQLENIEQQPNSAEADVIQHSFTLSPNQIMEIPKCLPPHLRTCSRFELITACLWRCRTLALNVDPDEVVQISCVVNARGKNINKDLHLPLGYYGNAFAFPAAVSKAGVLCKNPLGYAVELVKKAKLEMNAEYIRSVADLMVLRGWPGLKMTGNLIVSDVTSSKLGEIDLGWGYPEFGGPPMAFPLIIVYNNRGEDEIVVPILLPLLAMESFQQELTKLIEGTNNKHETMQRLKNDLRTAFWTTSYLSFFYICGGNYLMN
ncbi:hypothetical protein FNV43_RR10345 [Rhamnella rubrinervis]|uniref:Methanol O-anthraniloyltransferase-like n=1 Tax=Rhamnella rubrinervis TaxID=2594499 RepID=A0A8K0MKN8_9ROSA|nr:hypothetical protein FNV43_RR10345 [Rhamnella rubrinervis]